MREIKFRGKCYDTGKWVYGNFTLIDNMPAIVFGFVNWIDGVELQSSDWNYIKEKTVGQFTGLLDKNGLEIYEGDIVKTPLLDPIFGDILSDAFDNAPIEFSNGSFVVSYYNGNHKIYLQDLYDKIEVIGNIYDNPEMLDNGKE